MIAGIHTGLRAIEREDLEPLRLWRNRPELRRYFREHRELARAQQERWYETLVLADPATKMFAITALLQDRLLGAGGLCHIDWLNRTADFSLYIGADGSYLDDIHAPEAGRLLLDYGFRTLGMHRIWCEIYDFDAAKHALLTALGFTLDGRHREAHWAEGGWHDCLFFGLLDRDFTGPARPCPATP